MAFSASAFERFWAAVAIRSDFESIFRSIRWAILDRPKLSKNNETEKLEKVIEKVIERVIEKVIEEFSKQGSTSMLGHDWGDEASCQCIHR